LEAAAPRIQDLVAPYSFLHFTPSVSMTDSKHPPVTIPNSREVKIRSKNVDQEFKISISLPPSYNKTENKYPVLYLLDSNYHFIFTTGIVKFLNEFGSWNNLHVPEMIIVGIGYPAEGPDILTFRSRDYTPVEDNDFYKSAFEPVGCDPNFRPNSGGAPEFLTFITQELMPYIEEDYRVDTNDKTIAGHSYGGLFPSYVLFHKPDTFNKYILSSPSLWYKQGILFQYEEEYSRNHEELPVRVYLSAGANESKGITEGFKTMVEVLKKRNYGGLVLEHVFFEDEVHFSVVPPALTRGIISVFKQ